MKKTLLLSAIFTLLLSMSAAAQGIQGKITNTNKEALPYATIYVKEIASGAVTNEEGLYLVKLKPGTYHVVYQYLGYKTVEKTLTVENDLISLNMVLEPESIVLKPVEIKAKNEDPAYTIMRKAIAKAKYHTQQVDSYTCNVYMKGSGRLKDVPFFLRKTLQKEGIDSTFSFVSESVSEIKYTRPNNYDERVISVRAIGEDNNTSPNNYINGSFYDKELGGAISPLSPKAFSYYNFTYLGTFSERGYEVSKIKVVPRSKGDAVFNGFLYIVEDYWAIHSLNLVTSKLGIQFQIKQIYEPVTKAAWMPISHEFLVTGKVLGFGFEYGYLATVNDYNIQLNPDLDIELEVIDDKVEKELASKLKAQSGKKSGSAQEKLASGKEVTRKELRKLLSDYEKEEKKEKKIEEDVEFVQNFKVDSLAHKKDSSYWDSIRPVPLTQLEVKGYHKMDSMSIAQKKESEGDTLKNTKRGGFKLYDFLLGNTYKVGDKAHIRIKSPIETINFNTVEGYNAEFTTNFTKTFENKGWFKIEPTLRYGFDRNVLNYDLEGRYSVGSRYQRGTLTAKGGKYIGQINKDNPIHPLVNTFTSLFLGENHMKIYEKEYVHVGYKKDFTAKFGMQLQLNYENRKQLENATNYSLVNSENNKYTSNVPWNREIGETNFDPHKALTGTMKLEYRPFQKFYIRNKTKYRLNSFYPTFSATYTKGFANLADSDVDYDLIDFGYKHKIKAGARAMIDVKLNAGMFLNKSKMFFPDFKHFLGNRTPFVTTDPVGSFRLLPYYENSTQEEYLTGALNFQFRKLAITQIPILRLMGIKESIISSYLHTPNYQNYMEVGYSINYIFRFFRVEAISSFEQGKFKDFGVKVGIAANIDELFD